MKRQILLATSLLLLALVGCNQNTSSSASGSASGSASNDTGNAEAPTVITLTQIGCQFLETESQDFEYKTSSKADCEKINAETLGDREPGFKPLKLKPGKYVFRVTNQNVPYELGFYLRGKGISQATLPKVSGGGLTAGVTQDYEITLKPGEYVFSCPLNPTPDYPIVVQ